MSLIIQRGRITRPQKIVLYAPEGLGKSTIASQLENVLFIDLEQGTHHLDVPRVEPRSLKEAEETIDSLLKEPHPFRILVIDTIDWLEELAIQDICRSQGKKGIEDFGYGKGYVILAERLTAFLTRLEPLRATMHILVLAHSQVRKFDLPEQGGSFDRYELKLTRQVGPLIKEWCDALLFGNWHTTVKQPDEGKNKGIGGKERRLYCNHSAAWDAKNRHDLNDQEPWAVETLRRILGLGVSLDQAPASERSPVVETQPAATTSQVPPLPLPLDGNSDVVVQRAATAMELEKLLAGHPAAIDAVNAFLLSREEIKPGQTFVDVSEKYAKRILANPAGFLKVVAAARPTIQQPGLPLE
jgi:AAA domain